MSGCALSRWPMVKKRARSLEASTNWSAAASPFCARKMKSFESVCRGTFAQANNIAEKGLHSPFALRSTIRNFFFHSQVCLTIKRMRGSKNAGWESNRALIKWKFMAYALTKLFHVVCLSPEKYPRNYCQQYFEYFRNKATQTGGDLQKWVSGCVCVCAWVCST